MFAALRHPLLPIALCMALAQGADPIGMPAEEFRVYVKSELARWSKVVRASGATVE